MTKTAALGLAFAFAFAGTAVAQDGEPAKKPVPTEQEPAPEAEARQEPRPVRGVRYRIELRSGRVLVGVIRAKGIFERRADTGGYEPTDENDRSGGVRIWFPARQDGFVFMPISDVARLDELGELSKDEGKSLARVKTQMRTRADRERAQIKAAREAAENSAKDAADAEAVEAAAAEAEASAGGAEPPEQTVEEVADEALLAKLLIQYPPTRWSPETPSEIERRKVVLGLFPSAEEKAFLGVFDDWKRAYDAWLTANGDTAGDEETPPAEEKARRGRDGRRGNVRDEKARRGRDRRRADGEEDNSTSSRE